jgi:hypothetical protein
MIRVKGRKEYVEAVKRLLLLVELILNAFVIYLTSTVRIYQT